MTATMMITQSLNIEQKESSPVSPTQTSSTATQSSTNVPVIKMSELFPYNITDNVTINSTITTLPYLTGMCLWVYMCMCGCGCVLVSQTQLVPRKKKTVW